MRMIWRLVLLIVPLLVIAGALHAETVIERLVSPGPLSLAHARYESRCNACHVAFHRQTQDRQCLACHTGIARDIATKTRWHGLVPGARSQACRACHVEHKGSNAALTVFDPATFHHDTQSAYRLTGGHVRTACAACHKPGSLYRETPQACASCHASKDVHRGRLGPQCQACHTTARWSQVLPFDHDRTRYPLTGAHRTTPCQGCHVQEQWRGAPTACVSCHVRKDVHRGADGPACGSCHATTDWRTIAFDHERVRDFPLRGAHRTIACTGCHARTVRPDKAPVACVGCHLREDVHRNADGPKCESCHSQSTWKVAKFDHAKTSFPLVGAHVKVTCVACHPQSVDTVKVGDRCIDCHRKDDVHHDALGPMCERCHKQTSFIIPGLPRILTPRPGAIRQSTPRAGDFPRSGLAP
jgi:hypothetical protein